jgi:hypothetical protein
MSATRSGISSARQNESSKLYDEGVAALKANDVFLKLMVEKGVLVQNEAGAYREAKKLEYQEAMNALAIVNKIDALAWQTRYVHRKMQAESNSKDLDALVKNCHILTGCCDQLEKMRPDAEEKQQIADARRATQSYADTAAQEFEEHKRDAKSDKLAEICKHNSETGGAIVKAATDYLAAKEGKVNKIAGALFIVTDIAQTAPTARVAMMTYMRTKNPADWKNVRDNVSKLSKLYEDLRKVSLTFDDQQRIDRADKATQEYLASGTAWVENQRKLDEVILPQMKKGSSGI